MKKINDLGFKINLERNIRNKYRFSEMNFNPFTHGEMANFTHNQLYNILFIEISEDLDFEISNEIRK